MNYISLEDIIKKAKKRKISLGEDPEKTIKLSVKLGLLPKPKRKRTTQNGKTVTTILFPENTVDKLARIKSLKSEGLTPEEIRDSFIQAIGETAK